MPTLYIVRHGETVENAAGILQGHLQGQLSEKGIRQARELRDVLAHQVRPDRIFSSDLQRTLDTARILNEPFQLTIEPSPLLRERDWGEYTGRAISSIPKGEFPPSVETVAHMMERAGQFLQQLASESKEENPAQTVLIVSHGVFSRCLQAAASHKQIYDIPLMKNLEMRTVELTPDFVASEVSSPSGSTEGDSAQMLRHGQES